MSFAALSVNSCLSYTTDSSSGRCRIHRKAFGALKARLGYVAHIRLEFGPGKACEILCTLWPQHDESLVESEMCIDTSVVVSGEIMPGWFQCYAEVISVVPQRPCNSVSVQPLKISNRSYEQLSASALLGLPVVAGGKLNFPSGGELSEVLVSRINGAVAGSVISSATIIVKQPREPSSSSRSGKEAYCGIRVVRQLIDRVVRPAVDLPSAAQCKGVMLLGPPGVGKTYAVKAVKHICRDWCKIHVMELSIPMLLAESDPLQRLERIFTALQRLSRRPIAGRGAAGDTFPSSSSSVGGGGSVTPTKTPASSVPSTPASAASATAATPLGRTPLGYSPIRKTGSVATVAENSAGAYKFKSPSSSGVSFLGKKVAATPTAATPASPGVMSTVAEEEEVPGNDSSSAYSPELVFLVLDEVDALGKGGAGGVLQNAIKHRICAWLDSINGPLSDPLHSTAKRAVPLSRRVRCCLLATSNRAEDIDLCFRRGGRLEQELVVMTSQGDRALLLETLLTNTFPSQSGGTGVSYEDAEALSAVLAERTGGYVAADLVALVREMKSLIVTSREAASDASGRDTAVSQQTLIDAFETAIKSVPPSCLRGVSIQVPKISYSDVIGYEEVKRSLQRVLGFSGPERRELVRHFRLQAPGGVLLHGPPGNSKTRLVMAAACAHGLPVISLTSADIFSPYVGDAEAEIRKAFRVARQARPCVLFLDELDSIVTNRSGGGDGVSTGVEGRILATLLTEMDGIQGDNDRSTTESEGAVYSNSGGVIVLGATNRLDFIDAALIRKGRFHHVLHVPLPNEQERRLILEHFAKKCCLEEESGLSRLMLELREGMSGADIENLCREEVMKKIKILSSS